MHMLVTWFLNDEVAFKGDCLEILDKHREEFVDWRPNWDLYVPIRLELSHADAIYGQMPLMGRCDRFRHPTQVFLIKQALPSTSSSFKNISATTKEIEEHYDRGNEFFAAFLGPPMV